MIKRYMLYAHANNNNINLIENDYHLSAASQKEKITLNNLPAYLGGAYVELNDNVPAW